jgi:hypothetical protein
MRSVRVSTLCLILITTTAVLQQTVFAQSQLQITAPPANTVLAPGQTFAVSVTHSSDIVRVILMGDLIRGTTPVLSGANPLVFSVTVDSNKAAGIYRLAAVDVTPGAMAGAGTLSAPLTVDVEPTAPVSIFADSQVNLRFVGDSRAITAFAKTSSGGAFEITSSPELLWTSANPSVARIDSGGVVTGVGPGSTTVQLQYQGKLSASVPITVPARAPGDLDGSGRIDIDDVNILNMSLNSPASGPNDARDLNHDGRIDALDARILTTLCTYPRCATHP